MVIRLPVLPFAAVIVGFLAVVGTAPIAAPVDSAPVDSAPVDSAEAETAPPSEGQLAFFEAKVRPLLLARCGSCHGEKRKAGLQLTTQRGLFAGSDTGPVVLPGNPADSRLIQAVRYEGTVRMPPTSKLPPGEIAVLTRWVKEGAPWPSEETEPSEPAEASGERDQAQPPREPHWAFKPLELAEVPEVSDPTRLTSPVDRFVQARLDEGQLRSASRTDRRTLLRRVKFDLHGLPPTEAELTEFLGDDAPDAFARLVDRLLASPRYGEKWGRHWLDVARFATSAGVDEDTRHPFAWRYRDYVIAAFNRDHPFDTFAREQIAGDLSTRTSPDDASFSPVVGTGFLALGPKASAQPDEVQARYDIVDEQIDTLSKAFLGLTVSCARCHDHKFDPITTEDYYGLASIFASSRIYGDRDRDGFRFHTEVIGSPEEQGALEKHRFALRHLETRLRATAYPGLVAYRAEHLVPHLAEYMSAARTLQPDDEDLAAVAGEKGLDRRTLRRWVEFLGELKEEEDEGLPEGLEEWFTASPGAAAAWAVQIQTQFEEHEREFLDKLLRWKEKVETAFAAGEDLPRLRRRRLFQNSFHFRVVFHEDGPFHVEEGDWEKVLSPEILEPLQPLRAEQTRLEKLAPIAHRTSAVAEGEIVEQQVFLRGSHHNRGKVIAKRFPVVLSGGHLTSIEEGSGRRELGAWLAKGASHLTARVAVNRLWLWHFGEGLVRTPSNFGLRGERPTHPKLLDYLARRFIEDDWSVKRMHRRLLLSSTYQVQSHASAENWKLDPENRLWSRFPRRRLTVEEMRDSILALDGSLDLAMGGTLQPELGDSERGSSAGKPPYLDPIATLRRSVYVPIYRNRIPRLLSIFDFVDSTSSSPRRSETNVAPQGLFFMNSEFFDTRARGFAQQLLGLESDTTEQVRRAYRLTLTREPSPAELAESLEYMASYPVGADPASVVALHGLCRVLLTSNEFHYID